MTPETALPRGRVTIVFTDIEDSSLITKDLGNAAYLELLRNPHQAILKEAFLRHHGVPIQTQGDSFMAVFQDADDALACVAAIQNQLASEALTAAGTARSWILRVRIGVHTTEQDVVPDRLTWIPNADLVAGQVEYSGTDTNFAARVGSLGTGGQIVVSHHAYGAAKNRQQYRWQGWPNRRLKSFESAPETVWELLYDGQSRGEPGARWVPDWYRGELNRYIARPELQQTVVGHFKTGRDNVRRRLVTLCAEGGMGKSRLSVACALEMVGLFQHGVFFVNLAGDDGSPSARTREAVAQAIGLALGLSGQDVQPDTLLASLRSSERLLVLDNYESVDGKDVRRYIRELIVQTNSLCLLVTSRTPVSLPDVEQIVSLSDGMTNEQARSLFLAYAALTERGPDWTPDAEDELDLQRVLKLTEQIPLAVELAAAWAGSRTIKEIADGLQQTPLGRMTRTPGDTDRADPSPHHYSLTRSLDWSYSLLNESMRAAFAPLCLFDDSFVKEAVMAVLAMDSDDTEDLLDHLYRVSLLRRTESGKTSRYYLHRFTREYARTKFVELSKADEHRSRFVSYYCNIVAASSDLNDAKQRTRLSQEWRNALAAAHIAELLEDWPPLIALSDLRKFLAMRGLWSEQEALCRTALVAARTSGDQVGEGTILLGLSDVCNQRGQWDQAEQAARESLEIRQTLRDKVGEGRAQVSLGIVYRKRGLWDESEAAQRNGLAIFRELGDRVGEALALNNLGVVYLSRGQWDSAEKTYEECLIIERAAGNRKGMAPVLGNLGLVYHGQGHWDKAEQAHEDSLVISQDLGDRASEGRTFNNLGNVYSSRGEREKALVAYQQSLAIRRELGDRPGEGLTLSNLASVRGALEQWDEALNVCKASLTIYCDLSMRPGEAQTLGTLGEVYLNLRRWDEAERAYQESLAIRRALGDRVGEGEVLMKFASLMNVLKNPAQAKAYAQEAVAVLEHTEDRMALAKAMELLASM